MTELVAAMSFVVKYVLLDGYFVTWSYVSCQDFGGIFVWSYGTRKKAISRGMLLMYWHVGVP